MGADTRAKCIKADDLDALLKMSCNDSPAEKVQQLLQQEQSYWSVEVSKFNKVMAEVARHKADWDAVQKYLQSVKHVSEDGGVEEYNQTLRLAAFLREHVAADASEPLLGGVHAIAQKSWQLYS
eukprot:4669500-Amphidinium_carterae.1